MCDAGCRKLWDGVRCQLGARRGSCGPPMAAFEPLCIASLQPRPLSRSRKRRSGELEQSVKHKKWQLKYRQRLACPACLEACVWCVGDVDRVQHCAKDEKVPEPQTDRERGEHTAVSQKVQPMRLDECKAFRDTIALLIPDELERIIGME